eukprot:m.138519 g.138519  ORF g.138519 m.138519 type:complete len:69 (-) comp52531_c0_seq1:957-1163(-)
MHSYPCAHMNGSGADLQAFLVSHKFRCNAIDPLSHACIHLVHFLVNGGSEVEVARLANIASVRLPFWQ